MQCDPVETSRPIKTAVMAMPGFLVLLLASRAFGFLTRSLLRLFQRVLPHKKGETFSFVIVVILFCWLVDVIPIRRAFQAADASFEAAYILIEPGNSQPEDPFRTGSPGSLIEWQEMGCWGRSFVSCVRIVGEVAEFVGDEATDSSGHGVLDFMLGGDAAVLVQYSDMTSALSLLAHPAYGVGKADRLFQWMHDHWTRLPKERRLKLYVQGLNQRVSNSQSTVPVPDIPGALIDGVLWSGSPLKGLMWSRIRDDRDSDSPAKGPIRMIFPHIASDPIVAFTFDSAFPKRDWMKGGRELYFAKDFCGIPTVTMFQLALDMAVALKVLRYGHFDVAPDYSVARVEVVHPEGRPPQRVRELKTIFEHRPTPV